MIAHCVLKFIIYFLKKMSERRRSSGGGGASVGRYESLLRALSNGQIDPARMSPQRRRIFQQAEGISRRLQQRQMKKKLEFTFHVEVDGVVPMFVIQGSTKNPLPANVYQKLTENNGHLDLFPTRPVTELGILKNDHTGARTTLEWRGCSGTEVTRLGRIFTNEDRAVQWTQLRKKASQIVGTMNQKIHHAIASFITRRVNPQRTLEFELSNVRQEHQIYQGFNIQTNSLFMANNTSVGIDASTNCYMLSGTIRLKLGFNTMTEVMDFLLEHRYDFFTFYNPNSNITISYRDRTDPRAGYEPLHRIVNRSLMSSDLTRLLTVYMEKKDQV